MEIRLCTIDELPDNAGRSFPVDGKRIALFRVGDEVFALDGVCPHWGGPLDEGILSVERMEVTCPWHRFRFDLRTGRNVLSDIRDSATTYPVETRGGEVFVTLAVEAKEKQ